MEGILKNKKILITGGAGFIGSNLTEKLLEQGNQITCLDDFSTGKRENVAPFLSLPNYQLIEGSICDFETCKTAVKGIDVVLHQAALGSVPRSINDPITTNAVNISGFVNVLKAAQEEGVSRFVYAASSSTYGTHKALPKVEEVIGDPLSPYAVTKLVNELYARVFSDLYGIETIGLRYFNVFGKRQDPDGAYAAAIPKFIKAFINYESPVINGDGNHTRDFTFIENVILANELAATTTNPDAVNTVYNVAYGKNTNLNDLIEKIKTLLIPFDAKIASVNATYGPERIGDIRDSLASIEKGKKNLGYNPQYSWEQGLEKAIDWYWDYFKK